MRWGRRPPEDEWQLTVEDADATLTTSHPRWEDLPTQQQATISTPMPYTPMRSSVVERAWVSASSSRADGAMNSRISDLEEGFSMVTKWMKKQQEINAVQEVRLKEMEQYIAELEEA